MPNVNILLVVHGFLQRVSKGSCGRALILVDILQNIPNSTFWNFKHFRDFRLGITLVDQLENSVVAAFGNIFTSNIEFGTIVGRGHPHGFCNLRVGPAFAPHAVDMLLKCRVALIRIFSGTPRISAAVSWRTVMGKLFASGFSFKNLFR